MASASQAPYVLVRPIERSSAQQYLRSGPVPFANCGGGGPCVGEELGLCNRERNEIDVPLPDVLGQVLGRRSCPEEIDLPAVHRQKIGNHSRPEPVRVPFHRRHRGPHAQPRPWIHPLTQRVHHVYRDRSRQVLLGHVYRALVPQFTQPDLRRRQDFEIYVSAFDSSTQRRFLSLRAQGSVRRRPGLGRTVPWLPRERLLYPYGFTIRQHPHVVWVIVDITSNAY